MFLNVLNDDPKISPTVQADLVRLCEKCSDHSFAFEILPSGFISLGKEHKECPSEPPLSAQALVSTGVEVCLHHIEYFCSQRNIETAREAVLILLKSWSKSRETGSVRPE